MRIIGLTESFEYVRRMLRALRGQELWQGVQTGCEKISLGKERARWCVCAKGLSPTSVVYSFGVGDDVSFDLEMIRHFGVRVHAFDPTPRSIEWISKQSLPAGFVFHAFGIADFDGVCKFVPPENPAHVSHTMLQRESPWPAIEVKVHRLSTIMKMLNHERVDLLKMDIEGAEYPVLGDLLAFNIPVKQLLVEFHHRWPQIGTIKTKHAIRALNEKGYRIFSVSPSGEEYGFLQVESA